MTHATAAAAWACRCGWRRGSSGSVLWACCLPLRVMRPTRRRGRRGEERRAWRRGRRLVGWGGAAAKGSRSMRAAAAMAAAVCSQAVRPSSQQRSCNDGCYSSVSCSSRMNALFLGAHPHPGAGSRCVRISPLRGRGRQTALPPPPALCFAACAPRHQVLYGWRAVLPVRRAGAQRGRFGVRATTQESPSGTATE